MKDPKDEVDREPAGDEKRERGGDLDQSPIVAPAGRGSTMML